MGRHGPIQGERPSTHTVIALPLHLKLGADGSDPVIEVVAEITGNGSVAGWEDRDSVLGADSEDAAVSPRTSRSPSHPRVMVHASGLWTPPTQWTEPLSSQVVVTERTRKSQALHAAAIVRVAVGRTRVGDALGMTLVAVKVGGTAVGVNVGGTAVRVSVGGTGVCVSVGEPRWQSASAARPCV